MFGVTFSRWTGAVFSTDTLSLPLASSRAFHLLRPMLEHHVLCIYKTHKNKHVDRTLPSCEDLRQGKFICTAQFNNKVIQSAFVLDLMCWTTCATSVVHYKII